jgi:cysteine desulfurase
VAVYLDHNATSPASAEHLAQLFANVQNVAGNPSSPHAAGRTASVALTEARKNVATSLGCEASEIIFVSGGSEANNIATKGVLNSRHRAINELHAITSAIEHPCVLEPLRHLAEHAGLQLTILPVDADGKIRLNDLVQAIRPNTALVSVMVANNETGAVQPVQEFAQWLNSVRWIKCKPGIDWRVSGEPTWPEWARALPHQVGQQELQALHFHVDAVQAYGKIVPSQWCSLGFDSISVCAHKLGGLAGVGALLLRRGRKFEPLIMGGAQERSRRAGTENLLGILSLGLVAQSLGQPEWWESIVALEKRRNKLLELLRRQQGIVINTPSEGSLPNTLNVCLNLPRLRGEDLLMELDLRGFYVSSGSACSSGANRPSHVLLAQGRSAEEARNGLRFSLGLNTSDHDIELLCAALVDIFSKR